MTDACREGKPLEPPAKRIFRRGAGDEGVYLFAPTAHDALLATMSGPLASSLSRGAIVAATALAVLASTPAAAQHIELVSDGPRREPSRAQPEQPERPEAEAPTHGRPFPRQRWRWARADVGNYVLMGLGAATAGAMIGVGASGVVSPTRGGVLFDEDARNAVRLSDRNARLIAQDVSDGLLSLMTAAPILFDALVLGAWLHEDPDIALELILIHAEVITVTLGLQTLANIVASRERPYGRTCGGPTDDDLPEGSFFCNSPDRFYSFFSGHTSQAFASAAVVCSAHMNMNLLGGGAADAIPCVTGFVFAAATGLLRMMGDMHYATDVLTGAIVGTTVGFLLPWALHFSRPRAEPGATPPSDVRVTVVPTGAGASMFGIF